ncbi:serine/threonine-protein kinase [Streptomyces sp. NPDC094032]|uniref:serine/threonine-protein kinase n=1 Tax=Streptomyces sp. NPDC094032 TaxID=3155308 RepID=UPI00331F6452
MRRLGRGGMGVVWQAVDEVLGREVAVKELRTYTDMAAPELDAMRLRMRREARAAARVRHPGVVAVHDVTEHEGRPVIVMELVDGRSLDDVLAAEGPLDPAEAARIGARVLEALAAAHEAGVLHRDVKPGNILLDRSGRVLLTDFGIATIEDPGDGSAGRLTRSGEIVGSLDYLSPERARGEAPGPAADVWALGATLYAAVEGAVPFRRTSTWSTLAAIVADPLPEPVRSGGLAPVLVRLMAKDPGDRPSAREAAGMLAGCVPVPAAVPVPAPVGVFGPPVSVGPSKWRRVVAAVVGVLLVGGGVSYVLTERASGPAVAGERPLQGPTGEPGRVLDGGGVSVGPSASATRRAGVDKSASPRSGVSGSPSSSSSPSRESAGVAPSKAASSSAAPTSVAPTTVPPVASGCTASGGSATCQVVRTATSTRYDGGEMGTVSAGPQVFFCQVDLDRSESFGGSSSRWWARTDDDSGNTNVYVSVLHLRGGSGGGPVDGLRIC